MDKIQRKFFADLQSIYTQSLNLNRGCMCPNCESKPIFSHVFTRNLILKPICPDSKIYLFEPQSLVHIEDDDMLRYYPRGLKEAFGFNGFCSVHDNNVFADIEPKHGKVDWSNIRSQYLLSYRSICREAYVNRVTHDVIWHQINCSISNDPNYQFRNFKILANINTTYDNIIAYKKFLEKGVYSKDYSEIQFHYIELPFQFDLCISSPINVVDDRGPCFKYSFQETNLVNVFPYCGKTIIILGYSDKFENKWMNKIIPMFKSSYPHIVSAAFVELLYRTELNAIGPKLFEQLEPDLLEAFYSTYRLEANNFSYEIENQISCLFYKPLKTIMPDSWKTL